MPEIFVGELFLDDPESLLFFKVVLVASVESLEDELLELEVLHLLCTFIFDTGDFLRSAMK